MRWLFRLLPSPTPRADDHVSIWSVSAAEARMFFRIAGALWLAELGFLTYKARHEWPRGASGGDAAESAWRSVGDSAFDVLADFGAAALAIAVVAMLLTRAAHKTEN